MYQIMRLRKSIADNYSIGIPRDIGKILEENGVSDMKCTLIDGTQLEFKQVK